MYICLLDRKTTVHSFDLSIDLYCIKPRACFVLADLDTGVCAANGVNSSDKVAGREWTFELCVCGGI